MTRVELYDRRTIDLLSWPDTSEGQYAKRFLYPFIKNDVKTYIDNADTEMMALTVDDHVLPITVNETEYDSCYLCSPISQFVTYSKEKLNPYNPFIWLWNQFLRQFMILGKSNRVVMVNNWMLSTNLYPQLSKEQLKRILDFLKLRFPLHTILFRSLNEVQDPQLCQDLKDLGLRFLASRPIFVTDTKSQYPYQARMFKSDLKILRESEYTILENEEIPLFHAQRIANLYKLLNIHKYSHLNPQFNYHFITLALKERLLDFKVLVKNQSVDAVLGYFQRENVMTSPLFGYDTSLPNDLGLYRQIATILSLDAQKSGCFLNHSGGAASFKRLRRAQGIIEYLAIDYNHLPKSQKAPWTFLEFVMNRWGVRFIEKNEFGKQ